MEIVQQEVEMVWVGNLGEAAALTELGYNVVTFRVNPFNYLKHQTQFGFLNEGDLRQVIAEYWEGKLNLEPMAYYNAITALRRQRWEFEQQQDTNLENLRE